MLDEDRAWIDYRENFARIYDRANYFNPLQSVVMRASHKLIERAYDTDVKFGCVLEIGAGTGEHFAFIRHGFSEYILTDRDPQTLAVAEKKISGKGDGRVLFETQSGDRLTYADETFDRVVAAHVLEHIYQPHLAINEWSRVLKSGGVLSILIPTDPGLVWRLSRHLGPRRNAIAQGIAYDYIMAREHVNSCNNLIAILRHYFPRAKEAWWPLPIALFDVNLFYAFHAVVDKSKTWK